jgi:hypothetical protein
MLIIATAYHLIPVSSIASIQDSEEAGKTQIDLITGDSITCSIEYSLLRKFVRYELRIASSREVRFLDLDELCKSKDSEPDILVNVDFPDGIELVSIEDDPKAIDAPDVQFYPGTFTWQSFEEQGIAP